MLECSSWSHISLNDWNILNVHGPHINAPEIKQMTEFLLLSQTVILVLQNSQINIKKIRPKKINLFLI